MRILLTGKSGQVGWELQRSLCALGEVIALGSDDMNLANPDAIVRCLRTMKPDLIVNPAAYTAVDKAESEPDVAMAINGLAPGILAEEAKRLGAKLIHYSTDYVFDGTKLSPYSEEDIPNPVSVYGRTKLAGERAIQAVDGQYLILRTSWVYGLRGRNFLLTMRRLLQERQEISVVSDQYGAPTWSRLIAEVTGHIVAKSNPEWQENGVFHLTASGQTTWHEFAQAIAESMASQTKVLAIATQDYPTPAKRPHNSRLSTQKLCSAFDLVMPAWNSESQFQSCCF